MASGVIKGTTSNSLIKSSIEWSSTPVDDRHSKVTVEMYLWRTNSNTTYGTGQFFVTVGTTRIAGEKKRWSISSAAVKVVSGEVVVEHDADGSKSVAISGSGSIPDTSLSSVSCGGTAVLDTLVQTTEITSVNGKDDSLESGMLVGLDPHDTSLYTRLSVTPGNIVMDLGKIAVKTVADIIPTEEQITDIYYSSPNSAEVVFTVSAETYRDERYTDHVATTSETITLRITESSTTRPSLSATISPIGDISGLYVQNKSRVKATVSASGKYGASVTTTMYFQGSDYSAPFTSDPIEYEGTYTVEIRCVDSRGFETEYTEDITVDAYASPEILAINGANDIYCYRCGADGKKNDSGTNLYISARRSFATLGGKNPCPLVATISGTDIEFSREVVLIAADSPKMEFHDIVSDVDVQAEHIYSVKLTLTDSFGATDTVTRTIPQDKPTFVRGKGGNKASFGGYPEADDTLDVHWNMRVRGKLYLDGADSVVEQGTKDGWFYRKWASGWAECLCETSVHNKSYNSWGNIYVGATSINVRLPFEFAEPPHIMASVKPSMQTDQTGWIVPRGDNKGSTTETGNYTIAHANNLTNTTHVVSFDVRGYYKKINL